jgi:hypothetical protein
MHDRDPVKCFCSQLTHAIRFDAISVHSGAAMAAATQDIQGLFLP